MRRGLWALVDQALFAGANFAVTVALARWLSLESFGAYSAAFAVFILASTVHNGVVVEPLLVFGAGRFRNVLDHYLTHLVRLHWTSSALTALALGCVGGGVMLLGHAQLGVSIFAAALATPFGLFYWFARRIPYLVDGPRRSAFSAVAYGAILFASIVALKVSGMLSASTALLSIGFSGWMAGSMLYAAKREVQATSATASGEYRQAHGSYSRWAVGTGILGFIPSQSLLVVAPFVLGLEAVGFLKASLTVVGPVMQATAALSLVLLPRFVARRNERDYRTVVSVAALRLIGLATICSAGVFVFRVQILRTLFGAEMMAAAEPLYFLAWIPVFATAVNVFAAALRAVESPRSVFVSYAAAATVIAIAAVPFLMSWGAVGGALAMLLAYSVNAVTMWQFNRSGIGTQADAQDGA